MRDVLLKRLFIASIIDQILKESSWQGVEQVCVSVCLCVYLCVCVSVCMVYA